MRFTCLALLAAFSLTPSVGAQEEDSVKIPLWKADFGSSGKVLINVAAIVSITMHPYLLNGANMVTEVTVDTVGNNTLRFYYVHPESNKPTNIASPQEAVGSVRSRANLGKQKSGAGVPSVKFPEGAYAHSIEYQVNSLSELEKLYKSLTSVWEKNSQKLIIYNN